MPPQRAEYRPYGQVDSTTDDDQRHAKRGQQNEYRLVRNDIEVAEGKKLGNDDPHYREEHHKKDQNARAGLAQEVFGNGG